MPKPEKILNKIRDKLIAANGLYTKYIRQCKKIFEEGAANLFKQYPELLTLSFNIDGEYEEDPSIVNVYVNGIEDDIIKLYSAYTDDPDVRYVLCKFLYMFDCEQYIGMFDHNCKVTVTKDGASYE